jgi:hypothetical protein
MTPGSPSQIALAEFRVIADHIGTRDLVQEFFCLQSVPHFEGVGNAGAEGRKEEGEFVRLPYHYKFKKHFKVPCQE